MSKTLAQRLIDEAETWVGTRWAHQGRIKSVGVDCVNFISETARDAGIANLEIPNNYRPHEDGTVMLQLLSEHMKLVPTEEMMKGDVLAFCDEAARDLDIPRHLAFVADVTPKTTFIVHASQHGVRRHRIDAAWRRRIHSCWRLIEG